MVSSVYGYRITSYNVCYTKLLRILCTGHHIETGPIDGYWGQQTDSAYESLAYLVVHGEMPPPWRDDSPSAASYNFV